ncbi:MAG: CoA transferase [Acidobacteriota bacterium]|nr:CoA transferase [Acidobacteriota bacterium]
MISPPDLPRTLMVDLGAAENAVSTALSQLMMQKEDGRGSFAQISIYEIAEQFAATLRYGLTQPEGLLGGGCAGYNLYRTADGWIALAALETQFWQRVVVELNTDVKGKKEGSRVAKVD